MAFNRLMHPRNVFKQHPPDYAQLARKHPEFRAHCFLGAGGRICVNFDEPEAVRCLSRALLREYFGLDVELPKGALVPRIPQRLNYILLVEDLLACIGATASDGSAYRFGIDIGTGASCIFPLLGAKLHTDWHFYATEVDESSASVAEANARRNSLDDRIVVVRTEPGSIFEIKRVCHPTLVFAFTMCNPPFFDPEEREQRFSDATNEEHSAPNNSNSSRQYVSNRLAATDAGNGEALTASSRQPRSSTLAKRGEVFFAGGGEVAFVTTMADESVEFGARIRIFTTMLGRRSSVAPIRRKLASLDGMRHTSTYTLSQGRTQRWVVAWSFDETVKLPPQNR